MNLFSYLIEAKNPFLPKKYYAGLSLDEKKKRLAWFKSKKKKFEKNDYDVYKEKGPGQDKKTKRSNYTKWVNEKYGSLSLKELADKSGIKLNILKQVYKRGVGAWTSGHRPGASPQQWGKARVNAFIYKIKNNKKLNHDTDLIEK
jgi:primosomal protein N'